MGIVVKTFLIFADCLIMLALIGFEIAFVVAFVLWPFATIYALFI